MARWIGREDRRHKRAPDQIGEGGHPTRKWFVAKLDPEGALDTSFNETGYVLIESGMADTIGLITLGPNGDIVVMSPRFDIGRTYNVAKIAADGTRAMDYGPRCGARAPSAAQRRRVSASLPWRAR